MRLSEEEIRKITLSAIQELGDSASPEAVKNVVAKAVDKMDTAMDSANAESDSGKIILTSFGANNPGIVAAITAELSSTNCNILDISQKILSEYYTMIMVIDISETNCSFRDLQDKMTAVADRLGIKVYLQHENIFKSMHRI